MATHYLLHSPMYIDQFFTTFKDWDGELLLASDYEDPPVAGLFKHIPGPKEADPLPVLGQAFGSHEAFVGKDASGSSTGGATATATGNKGLTATGSATGVGTATADAGARRNLYVTSLVEFAAELAVVEAAAIGGTPGIRYPWSPLEDLSPGDGLEVGCLSDLSVNNRVGILDSATLKRDPAYSGPDYVLGGPPDDAATPKQLGVKAGEQLVLIGLVGSEAHHGRRLTLQDPNAWSVYEVLDPADTNWYQFRVIRSVT